ncbi:MAG TPA: prephenate dehydrogenase/arogenate dehydrogenase family protein [Thermoanaerobaculia bacterium]|jgi:prephenate dehydrogenase|nr:prephenate dehydrogenase/arogenate dehydrogenase family protein [Thermoanaerobaculia bacterium]
MPPARRTLIAGLGLIGGSIGIALRRHGWHVTYIDPGVSLDDAVRARAADERKESFDGTFDITVLATPVDAAIAAIERCRSLTTSVCSVLQPLRAAAGLHGVDFVAGHPLAGSHERGLDAARADLFEGASWFVDREVPVVQELIACCGARAELVTAAEHDRTVALTSHLPQILSTALAAHLHDQRIDPRFAGSGLRTFLRLAGSAASVWSPIIAANRENIAPHAEAVVEIVRGIVERGGDEAFAKANEWGNDPQRTHNEDK